MERKLRLLDHVYRRNDIRRKEGKIISVEESVNDQLKYIVFFPDEDNYFYFNESDLCRSNNTTDNIFSDNILKQHPFQQKELSDEEIHFLLDGDLDNPKSRRCLWYDILFYKQNIIPLQSKGVSSSMAPVHPTILRLLRYPIPEEIRCFIWSIILDAKKNYEIGYYSIVRNRKYVIPANNLHVIQADLQRMNISDSVYMQLFRLLTSIYVHDIAVGYVQGLHNVAYALLQLFTEEEAFFVFPRVVEFLPDNFYTTLAGVSTDLLVIATVLNMTDSFLYTRMELLTSGVSFFLSPVWKWIFDIFSDPFPTFFTYPVLDLVFCLGNWSIVSVVLAVIHLNRRRFITSLTMEEIYNVYDSISADITREDMPEIIETIYEQCLMTDINGIMCLREELIKSIENVPSTTNDAKGDEQSGVVGEMCVNHKSMEAGHLPESGSISVLSKSSSTLHTDIADMDGLMRKFSQRMQSLNNGVMRVSGFEEIEGEYDRIRKDGKRRSIDSTNDRIPNFYEISEEYDDETDEDPWRDSFYEENSFDDSNSISNNIVERLSFKPVKNINEEKLNDHDDFVLNKRELQPTKKLGQMDVLFKKVAVLYNDIRDQRTYEVTNDFVDRAADGHFLLEKQICIIPNYLSCYSVNNVST